VIAIAAPGASAGSGQLIVAAVLGIAVVVVLIAWGTVHPFRSLLLGAVVLGIVGGPAFWPAVFTILLPVVLMLLRAVGELLLDEGTGLRRALDLVSVVV
jgi:H+/gluconate symporter-like permease